MNYKAHFSSESFPTLMFWIERSSRREQDVTVLLHHLSALLHFDSLGNSQVVIQYEASQVQFDIL